MYTHIEALKPTQYEAQLRAFLEGQDPYAITAEMLSGLPHTELLHSEKQIQKYWRAVAKYLVYYRPECAEIAEHEMQEKFGFAPSDREELVKVLSLARTHVKWLDFVRSFRVLAD